MAAQPAHAAGSAGRRLRGVVFDIDGVLADSEPLIAEAAIRMFAERGLEVHPEEFRPFVVMGEDRFIGGVAEAHGVSYVPDRDKKRTYEIYLEIIPGRLKPVRGAPQFVAACRNRGLAIAAASSADAIKVEANLREIGLPIPTFQAVVNGDEVQRKKPAPDLFLAAMQRLGLPPESCLVVEDAVAGVAAARAAGSRCLGLTTTFTPQQLAGADWFAPNLAEVPPEALEW